MLFRSLLCLFRASKSEVESLSRVQLFVTPWTVACQASLARILEWVAMSSSRGSSPPREESPALAGGFFTTEPPGKPEFNVNDSIICIT